MWLAITAGQRRGRLRTDGRKTAGSMRRPAAIWFGYILEVVAHLAKGARDKGVSLEL